MRPLFLVASILVSGLVGTALVACSDDATTSGTPTPTGSTASTFDHIQTDTKETRSSGTTAVSGTSFTLTTTCQFPAGTKAPQTGTYTATATSLTLLQAQGTGVFELTYTKK